MIRKITTHLAPWAVGLGAGVLALGPALGPGYALRYDMVFVPDPPLSREALGGGGFPRAVPSDAAVGLLGRILPGDVVQAVLLLAVFAVAAAGAARLVPGPWPAKLAAAVFYVWNPFLAERLLLGQWAVLLGYAGLPWVLNAAARLAGAGDLPRMVAALLPAAIGGFSSVVLSAIVGFGACVMRPLRRAAAAAAAGVLAAALLLVSLPWLIPALRSGARTDPAAVDLFAARADTPFGTVGSLISLGGIWNAQAVPTGYETPFLAACRLALSVAGLAGWVWLLRREGRESPRVPFGAGLSLAAGLGFAIALLGVTEPGRELLRAAIGLWPGFGPLRDGHLYIAPLALLQAVGLGAVLLWFGAGSGHGAGEVPGEPLVSSEAGQSSSPPAASAGLWTPAPRRLGAVAGVLVALLTVAVLPGLAWGAGGKLTPVGYPAEWREVQAIVNSDPEPGALVSLPWSAYRGLDWGAGETPVVLDPATKLFDRRVVWNDELRVEVEGEVRTARGEDPLAREVAPIVADGWPFSEAGYAGSVNTPEGAAAEQLAALGIRYVLVNRAAFPASENTFSLEFNGAVQRYEGAELLLLEVSDGPV